MLLTFAVMFSYDIRVILCALVFSLWGLRTSKIKFSQIRLMLYYVLFFLLTNAFVTFLFAPELGVSIYGTRHELLSLFGPYHLTAEQLFYQTTKLMKYASLVPLGIIFLLTTNPSEFAASLNGVGVNYKAAFAVALTLRYFPDIQRNYQDISQAQQARGLEMTNKVTIKNRFKNSLLIILPLIFSTLDRIELITNAMDLRGFAKSKKRTWYNTRKLTKEDFAAIGFSIIVFIITICISAFINHGRYFNPFI
jgi:energy-coupling factor transport system permease protein